VAGKRFINGVVDDLVHHVMQAAAVIGVADIHARPLAHGVEAFQNPDRFRAVFDGNGMLSVGDRLPGSSSCVAFEGGFESAAQK